VSTTGERPLRNVEIRLPASETHRVKVAFEVPEFRIAGTQCGFAVRSVS
jgi:hypothetical protein